MPTEQFKAIFTSQKGLSSPVILELKGFSHFARSARAFLVLLIGLTVSALLLGVPIIHFFAVPLGLVLTVVLAVKKFKTNYVIQSGAGACPACGKEVKILKRPFRLPFTENCEHCRKDLKVQIAEG
jgi:hypothetical protein